MMNDDELPGMWSYSDFTYGQTDAEEESAMSTITAIDSDEPSYEEWLNTTYPGQRKGQALTNALPSRLYHFVTATQLDAFYIHSPGEEVWNEITHERRQENIQKMSRFITWVYLCWDITDEDEMEQAYRLVMKEEV